MRAHLLLMAVLAVPLVASVHSAVAPAAFAAAGTAHLTYYTTPCEVPIAVSFLQAKDHFLLSTTYGPPVSGPFAVCSFVPAAWSDAGPGIPPLCDQVPYPAQLAADGGRLVVTASYPCDGPAVATEVVTMVRSGGQLAYTDEFRDLHEGDIDYHIEATLPVAP